jgi:DNA-directed RNA polymerase subunit F
LFVTEVPEDLAQIKEELKKDHKHAYAYAHKLNQLDLLGLNVAFEEILQSMDESEGKRKDIDHTFKSIKSQVKDAIKIKKGF